MPDKTTQIVAGKDGDIEDFPFSAQIQRRESRQDPWINWTGATILSRYWLVTSVASKKGPIKNMRIRFGFDDLSARNKQIRTVRRFVIHPRYKEDETVQYDNNIALIKLRRPLKFGPKINSISYTTIKGIRGLKNCQISGWGFIDRNKTESPDTLQFARISLISNTKCNDLASPKVPKNQICAYDYKNKRQACNGDGGGPLTCKRRGKRVLIGVFSWLYDYCHAEKPFAYSSLAYYTSFIEKVTGIKGTPSKYSKYGMYEEY
ncbi:serine protease 55-like [Mytilus edulis]|uniref:serine protease 55-like n=1 Tax=Mytilus edulis TaxID=6550 RepID=UPI0039EF5132